MKRAIFLLCFLMACTHKAEKPKIESVPFEEALKRENTDLTEFTVLSSDGLVELKVKAKSQPKLEREVSPEELPFYYLTVDIGTLSPVECFLYPQDINPAASLKLLTGKILSQKDLGQILEKKTILFGAGITEGNPFLLLNTAFGIENNGKKTAGILKTFVGSREIGSTVCVHNEVGYQKTFSDRFSEVLTSYRFKNVPQINLMFKSIMLLSIKDIPVGYIVEYVSSGQNETNAWVTKSSMLLPQSEKDVFSQDDMDIEISNHEGIVLNGVYKSQSDNELAHVIQLKTNDGRNYVLQGQVGDKKLDQTLKTPAGIMSDIKRSHLVSENFFQKKLQSFSTDVYEPSSDPYGLTKVRITLKKANDEGAIVKINDGKNPYSAVIESDGTFAAITLPVQDGKIEGKTVFRQGRLRHD